MRLPRIILQRRLTPSTSIHYFVPLLSVVLALIFGAFALLTIKVNPLHAYQAFITGALGSFYSFTEVCAKTIPLILCGLAVALPMKANLWNIGAEGQLYIGATFGGIAALSLSSLPGYLLLPTIIVVGFASGAIWGLIAGFLKIKFKLNEILTTLMLNYVGVLLYKYFIFGPLRDEAAGGAFPHSAPLPEAARLARFFGSRMHAGLILALVAVFLIYLVMKKMRLGYEITFVGANPVAAQAGGINTAKIILMVMLIGGGLAGVAGISEVSGVQIRMREGISPGYGFAAIPIAFLGRGHPFGVVIAAFFFGIIFVGGSHMQLVMQVPVAIAEVIQALIILFIICGDFLTRYRILFVPFLSSKGKT